MADIFDQHADKYSETINCSLRKFGVKHDFFAAHKARLLAKLLQQQGLRPQGCRLLDVGCGTGVLHAYINGQFAHIDGVDSSRESIRVAAERFPMNGYVAYSGNRLPYGDNTFDVAIAVAVFHHVPPADRPGLASEMLRVLRADGLAVVFEHNPLNPVTRHIVSTCELDKDAILLRPSELRSLFVSAGARSIRTRTVLTVPPFNTLMFRVDKCFGYLPFGAQYYLNARAPG